MTWCESSHWKGSQEVAECETKMQESASTRAAFGARPVLCGPMRAAFGRPPFTNKRKLSIEGPRNDHFICKYFSGTLFASISRYMVIYGI